MEFIALDISLLVISLIVATAIILLYSFSSAIFSGSHYCVGDFAVVDIVRYLKKLCPISFTTKWKLLPLNSGLSRCWTKIVQLPGFQSNLNVCGVSCAVPCSSVYAFSLIADVSKWGEWDHLPSSQCLLLKPFTDDKLQKDSFMQADQVVGIQRGTNVQSYIAMYRFMSFSEKTVKWILFWNVKKLEFVFFLIQPAISKTADSQCLITQIFGSKQLSSRIATVVAQRLKNIKEFLQLSQLHIVASNCLRSLPAVSAHLSQSDAPKTQQSVKSETSDKNTQCTFMLVPVAQKLTQAYKRLTGFYLTIKVVNVDLKQPKEQKKTHEKQEKEKMQIPVPLTAEKMRFKRAKSESYIKSHINPDFISNLENTCAYKDSVKTRRMSDVKRGSSIIVEENLKLDIHHKKRENESSPEQNHSFSDPGMPSTTVKQKSPSHSSGSDMQTDEETYVHLHIIHENEATENSLYKNDLLCSSTSEFELTDLSQQFLDFKIADFLTQGNYGASELQAEMMLASQYDKTFGPEEQIAGKWGYHSNYKGITVLSKTNSGQFMKIHSFLCQVELPEECKDVWKCVKNPRLRFMCDETVKTVKIIERISDSQKLIHVYHEVSSGLLRKEAMDFCLLQTEREETNLFYSSFHSMEYEKCPFMTSVIRGTLRPSGWVVEHLGTKKCKVTYLMQILVSSPDSLFIYQLSTLMPLALLNLKNYIASMPS